jgi:hypothetical protein
MPVDIDIKNIQISQIKARIQSPSPAGTSGRFIASGTRPIQNFDCQAVSLTAIGPSVIRLLILKSERGYCSILYRSAGQKVTRSLKPWQLSKSSRLHQQPIPFGKAQGHSNKPHGLPTLRKIIAVNQPRLCSFLICRKCRRNEKANAPILPTQTLNRELANWWTTGNR